MCRYKKFKYRDQESIEHNIDKVLYSGNKKTEKVNAHIESSLLCSKR